MHFNFVGFIFLVFKLNIDDILTNINNFLSSETAIAFFQVSLKWHFY
jgi:hypothetical protein